MRRSLILALAVLFQPMVSQASVESSQLNRQVLSALDEERLTGIVWSTVSGDEVQLGSGGHASKSPTRAMSADHKVQVGSVTKSVLAIGVLRLVTQGELSLQTNVEQLLSEVAFNNPWHATDPVTVEHLLTHTAGLDNIRMWQFMSSFPTPSTPLSEAFPATDKTLLKVRSRPGTQYSYSNMGYALLGMVIEKVTGQRYEAYLDDQLLAPLGMRDSSFEYLSQANQAGAMAMGHFENDVAQPTVPMFLRPAGQFTTTAADMARFMRFLMGDGRVHNEPFVDQALLQALGHYADSDASRAGLLLGHGLAFAMRDRHGVLGQCHPGTTLGFRAYICLFPESGKGFFWAVNTDSETADYERINKLLIKALSIPDSPVEAAEPRTLNVDELEGWYVLSPNNMAEFALLDLAFNAIRVAGVGDKLAIKSLQAADRVFIPLDDRRLRALDRTRASLVVVKDDATGTVISDGLYTYQRKSVLILLLYWASFALGLAGLVYLIVAGLLCLALRKRQRTKALFWPLINLAAFALPAYFYSQQSFLKFGEMTTASISLALLTGLLPVSLTAAIIIALRSEASRWRTTDVVAATMALQLCLLLFAHDLLPTVFWS
ncbi:MAG: hypothetical protein DHS20C11_20880 [Lysobacteraceae bacterium]|nr:MAG: hypothetical protein DHS20C11_20880 [Xanthomonadaceae bacterium]